MRKRILFLLFILSLLLIGCGGEEILETTDGGNTANSTDDGDSGDLIIDTGDSADSADSGDTANSANSGNTGEHIDGLDPEADEDGDGIKNGIEAPKGIAVDTDEDGTPDYKDSDSDNDGIPDSVEGTEDTDGDGAVNYRDVDSDGDNILDETEAGADPTNPIDSDEDGMPDYKDFDSDNDGIKDLDDGVEDPDKDDLPAYLDTDSDGDSMPDSDEKGPGDAPQDTDKDGVPDFLDFDSDNDGLSDKMEYENGYNPYSSDTDGDGFDDNVENAYGEQIDSGHTGADYVMNPSLGIPADVFYLILPYEDPETVRPLDFQTDIKNVDILIQVDLSGSMAGAIANLKSGIQSTVISSIRNKIPNSAFGLASFDDFESGTYGGKTLVTYKVNQPITTNTMMMAGAVSGLDTTPGSWEPHVEALYQSATGEGLSSIIQGAPVGTASWADRSGGSNFPAANCMMSEGKIGGACFRADSLPIFVMMTDEMFEKRTASGLPPINDKGDTNLRWKPGMPISHTLSQATNAMNAINAKFIGVYYAGESNPLSDLQAVANATNSKSKSGDYFIYTISSNGSGLSTAIADAVVELTGSINMDVTTTKLSVDNIYGIDTTLFIRSIIPNSTTPPNSFSSKDFTTFYGVKPGAKALFDVSFRNTIYEPDTTNSTLFRTIIEVHGQGTTLDTRDVLIIVPGKPVTNGGR